MGFLLWAGRSPKQQPGVPGWELRRIGEHAGCLVDNHRLKQESPEFHSFAEDREHGHWLLLAGQIANAEVLRRQEGLETAPDAAAICLALYGKLGDKAFESLEGSWSICLLEQDGSLLLARDRIGLHPLFYAAGDGSVQVASDESLLIHHAGISTDEDRAWLAAWFASRPTPPGRTAFKQIAACPPGNLVRISADGKVASDRMAVEHSGLSELSFEEAAGIYRDRLQSAVEHSLTGAERPCIMLSGGMDSLPVAAIAAGVLESRGQELQAVSWTLGGFADCDESGYIHDAAAFLHLPVHFVEGSHRLPFADAENIETGLASPAVNAFHGLVESLYQRAGALGCDLLLNAGFGDALFPYVNFLLLDALKSREFSRFWREIACIRRLSSQNLLQHWAVRRLLRELAGMHGAHRKPTPAWIGSDAKGLLDPAPWPPEADAAPHPDHYQEVFNSGIAADRARAAEWARRYGLQRRDPYNAPELLALMQQLPATFSWWCGTDKLIARQAARGLLPEQLRTKPRTGLLDAFWNAGYRDNIDAVRRRMRQTQDAWGGYLDSGRILAELGRPDGGRYALQVWQALCYASWRKKLGRQS